MHRKGNRIEAGLSHLQHWVACLGLHVLGWHSGWYRCKRKRTARLRLNGQPLNTTLAAHAAPAPTTHGCTDGGDNEENTILLKALATALFVVLFSLVSRTGQRRGISSTRRALARRVAAHALCQEVEVRREPVLT
eukprot:scaffold68508_cov55-Phaeocystis_antarctica.AAC.4